MKVPRCIGSHAPFLLPHIDNLMLQRLDIFVLQFREFRGELMHSLYKSNSVEKFRIDSSIKMAILYETEKDCFKTLVEKCGYYEQHWLKQRYLER